MDRFERAGQAFTRLCRIMAELRAPGGCPWDREQTLESLKPYLIEEAYETIEAIDKGDPEAHREELGDLLLQVVFQAELTAESGRFDAAAVADAISDKLVRRHPHVFGDKTAKDAAGALASWEGIKANERPKHKGALAGVPRALPALLRAMRAGEKAGAVGFDWNQTSEVFDKVEEEWSELREAVNESVARSYEELGDVLFALVNLSRRLKLDPESALQHATDKFARRFEYIEARVREQGRNMRDVPLAELDGFWDEAKAREPK